MRYYEVAPTKIVRQNSHVFTYESENEINTGSIVLIEIGKKQIPGVVMREVNKPEYATKPIATLIEDNPLPIPLVELAKWLSTYYATHLALVLQSILPRGVQKTRRASETKVPKKLRAVNEITLNNSQKLAVKDINNSSPGTIILHGVTGSGKTAVYIDVVKKCIHEGKSAIVLVPEIALTTQIVDEFSTHFNNILLTHSRQTESERHKVWKYALNSNTARVAIGPRSALFTPFKNIGIIIIDEFHEPSFKQEQSPRYSALRAASTLASQHSAKLILGSATPPITDYYLAKINSRPVVAMRERAQPAQTPNSIIINMTDRSEFRKHRFFSDKLLAAIEDSLNNKKQSLVFHNRRGSTTVTLCKNCGWQAVCPKCYIPMSLHADNHQLRCHICGLSEKVPVSCPVCKSPDIIHKGIGTKLIESELKHIFPKARIARFDGDNSLDNSLNAQYEDLYNGNIDIVIGTQVVAKGLDLPNLQTVGVIQADSGLNLPDYQSTERTFQLIAQVAGRIGRSDTPTNLIVQSYHPTHPSIVDGLSQNYEKFYQEALAERQKAKFPPYTYLLQLTCVYKTEMAAIRNAQRLARELKATLPKDIEILGPTPAFYERQHDTYRWQLLLKSHKRSLLVDVLSKVPDTHWQFELDPLSLL